MMGQFQWILLVTASTCIVNFRSRFEWISFNEPYCDTLADKVAAGLARGRPEPWLKPSWNEPSGSCIPELHPSFYTTGGCS